VRTPCRLTGAARSGGTGCPGGTLRAAGARASCVGGYVIQALLGHATLDTVMVYAKLYPSRLLGEYRKAVRGTYESLHGHEAVHTPTAEEWAQFSASCSSETWAPMSAPFLRAITAHVALSAWAAPTRSLRGARLRCSLAC